ncbi:MAG: transketolase [Lachnospiraceae bacterium]|jgi:transketolase|nr:transketolase [Lachnospiraceae bacterium]
MAKRIVFEGELDLKHLNLVKALAARELYVEELGHLAEADERIVITGADVGASGQIGVFKKNHPDRFIDTGIAEADQVGISAGLALNGKIVYLQGFGPFLALRALDQVHTDIAYQNVPVRIINTHAGLTSGGGPTHYNIMDLAIMRNLPNMTVIAPSDSAQCIKAIRATLEYPGPVCIRIARGAEPTVYTTEDYEYEVGKAVTALEGTDITVIATGSLVALAISAANGLMKEGISVRVIDMHTIKPLDREVIIKAAKETRGIITAEDHLVVGGLGSAVAEVIADENLNTKFKRLGIPDDDFPPLGDCYELYAHLGYDPEGIKKAIREMMDK